MTSESLSRAIMHAEEFLDDSKDVTGTINRRARAIVMECLSAMKPKQPLVPQAVADSSPLIEGLESHRSPIFETTTEERGWANGLLFAIETAKRMGVTNFEIQTKQERGENNEKFRSYQDYLMGTMGHQFEEPWKQQQPGHRTRIIIFAVTVK